MRAVEQGLFYFPLDCKFFQNKKIKKLRRAHGSVGVVTYINLLCRIYERGYYITFDNIEDLSMDIAEDIAYDQLRRTATQVTETISYLVSQDILDERLFEKGVISGKAIQEQYVDVVKGLKRKATIGIYSLLEKKEEGGGVGGSIPKNDINSEFKPINSEEKPINSEEKQQRERENKKENITHSLRAYGRYANVMLTEEQFRLLSEKIPDFGAYVDRFSDKLMNKGYSYPNHYDAIESWWEEDRHKYKGKSGCSQSSGGTHIESTYDLSDFFKKASERSCIDGT